MSLGQVTCRTPEPVLSLQIIPVGRRLNLDVRFGMRQAHIQRSPSVEPGTQHASFRSLSRDSTTSPPRLHDHLNDHIEEDPPINEQRLLYAAAVWFAIMKFKAPYLGQS
ncbi:hypothetical protein AVEN_194272-1 [Araneus ventricosus]|uniref:Uncharacterized protein n=1 Tax=Araneus ventricosus TaxID=182803 RepID=A0A4Y2G5N9_ARAVE|nr:hypothetical protein AVEN_194272-1 [Araneus ventricosus]